MAQGSDNSDVLVGFAVLANKRKRLARLPLKELSCAVDSQSMPAIAASSS